MRHPLRSVGLAVALAFAGLSTSVSASATPAPTIEQLFSNAKFGFPVLSPEGKKIAVTVPVNGRKALAVLDLESRSSKLVAASKDWDIANARWISERRLVFSINDSQATAADNRGGGLFAVDAAGGPIRKLGMTVKEAISEQKRYRPVTMLQPANDGTDDILVVFDERNGDPDEVSFGGVDVYRMDTRTGRSKMLTFDSPGKVQQWVVDPANQVRVGISLRNDKAAGKLMYHVYYRENQDAKWQLISKFGYGEAGFMPVGFDSDNKTMYVAGRGPDDDTVGLYTWDFDQQAPKELVLRHPRADFGGSLLRDAVTRKVIGAAIDAMKPEVYYFDQDYADLQGLFDVSLKGTVNSLQKRGDRVLVTASSSTDPGQVYLYDAKTRKMEFLLAFKPDVDPSALSEMQVTQYTARDGLTIPAYLTLPKDKPSKNLPLVVFVHGGPHARDEWGYNPYVQHLASRGFAVLQPQFRMSTGLGWKLHRAGWKQWGLAMQDDLTDGVNWLVKQGMVDPSRVCIMGASYGGYATMFGLAKDPDLYQCGVNFVGVTDIRMLFTVAWSDTSGGAWAQYQQKAMHGDPEKDVEYMKNSSALEQAHRIKKPVLMAYGAEDIRVPLIHGERMRDKLLKQGNTVEWMVFPGEGHGWVKEENRYKFAQAYQDFIERYIGDGAKPAAAPAKPAS
jgi:dipeptidyl aminopeptidase/acylaminoacyl peptidase